MTTQERIDIIMDYFDFGKVHRAMTCLKWRWGSEVPEESDLRASARKLLKETVEFALKQPFDHKDTEYSIGAGGLKASAYKKNEGEVDLVRLTFVLSEWESYEEEDD